MMLHLVTDRCRLAPGADFLEAGACLVQQVRHAVAAGVDLIQLREPDLEGGPLAHLVKLILPEVLGSRTRVVVNDRLDVALATGAHGVHLRATSLPAARVRALAPPGFLVGQSVHTVADVAAAGPVDYIVAGSVWPTAAKASGHPVIGPAGLAAIVRVSHVPVVAIGGIVPQRVTEVVHAGVAGVAAIGAWMAPGGQAGCRAAALRETADTFRAAFQAANMGRTFGT